MKTLYAAFFAFAAFCSPSLAQASQCAEAEFQLKKAIIAQVNFLKATDSLSFDVFDKFLSLEEKNLIETAKKKKQAFIEEYVEFLTAQERIAEALEGCTN